MTPSIPNPAQRTRPATRSLQAPVATPAPNPRPVPRLLACLIAALACGAGLAAAPASAIAAPALAANAAAATPASAATAAAPAKAPADAAALPPRARLGRQFQRQMRASQFAAAAATADTYLTLYPADGLMAYNLACARARLGQPAAAWTALERALASPQIDLRQLATDPDLAPLRADPRYAGALARARDRLRAEADRQRLVLREGYWSESFQLEPNDGSPRDDAWPQVSARLQSTQGSLMVSAEVRAPRFLDRLQPWRNGDGLRLTVAVPHAGDAARESDHSFGFGFGLQDALPVAALEEQDGRSRPVMVLELAPKIRLDEKRGVASYSLTIPWAALAPYAPPLDTLLGINLSYLCVGADRVRRTVSWLPDPALDGGGAAWRRYVPVVFRPSDRSQPALRGTLPDAVVEARPVAIRFVGWLPQAGSGDLRVDVLDVTGQSVISGGEKETTVPVVAGVNRWPRALDVSALPVGPYLIQAVLRAPGVDLLRWHGEFLRLDPDWLADARARAARARADDRPSLDYRLDAIEKALAERAPRSLPGALTSTLVETRILLQRVEKSGDVLPDSGRFLAAFPDGGGTLHPCQVWLPSGYRRDAPHRLLLLLPGGGQGGEHFADLVAVSLRPPTDAVIVAPSLPDGRLGEPGSGANEAAGTLAAALRWSRERFRAGPALVAGLYHDAPAALELSLSQPALCRSLLLWPTPGEPWPIPGPAPDAAQLRARRNRLPYELVEGKAPAPERALGDALQAAGFAARRSEAPAEGPSAVQIALRLAEWAGWPGPRSEAPRAPAAKSPPAPGAGRP